jgi:hypothetical protein
VRSPPKLASPRLLAARLVRGILHGFRVTPSQKVTCLLTAALLESGW